MAKYKSLKIVYRQHMSIRGWGLSVNAPAISLVAFCSGIEKDSANNPMLKVFYNRAISSLKINELIKCQTAYNAFKIFIKADKNSSKNAELANELNERRREFAKKIEYIYDALVDRASRFQGEMVAIREEIEKYKTEKCKDEAERSSKFEKIRAKKARFFNDELEIHNVDNLTNEELEERLKSVIQLFDEFLHGNENVMKKIKADLKYIANRKIKAEELDEDEGDSENLVISTPKISQGIKLDAKGHVIK